MRIPTLAAPYVRLAKRLLLGPGSLDAAAFRRDVLCPEEVEKILPAVFLPGQLDRVSKQQTGAWGYKARDEAIAEAISTTVTYAPTIAYHIENAILFDGRIFAGRFKYPIAEKSLFESRANEENHIKSAALASSYLGTKYFGHWLADDCTRYLLAEDMNSPLCVRMPAYAHRHQYQTYFGQHWAPTDRAHIDHLVIYQDFSQNSLKQRRYKKLRGRIKAHFPKSDSNTCVYLRRGETGVLRTIQNEREIVDALAKRGFTVLDVATDNLECIIGTLINAKIVVSMEGSHIAHCTFTIPENSGLLILEPPDRFSGVHRSQAGCLGIRFGFVVGDHGDSGYRFSLPEILNTIDLLLFEVENKQAV